MLWQPGDLKVHAGTVAEDGWHIADGREASRTEDAALFAKIGTRWGAGDGATTFNLPNYTDRMILGASATRPVGTTGGAETVALTAAQNGPHFHTFRESVEDDNPDPGDYVISNTAGSAAG